MSVQRMTRRGVVLATVFGTQPLWRTTLRKMLDSECLGTVSVCSTLEDLAVVLESTPRPHLLVADPDGVPEFPSYLRELSEVYPTMTTIMVTEETDAERVDNLLAAGAVEVMTKHAEVEEIQSALRDAIGRRLAWARLTARELEILHLVALGGSNREVAATLWLSDQTVKFHLANVYRKLGVTSRAEAVERARAVGLLSPLSSALPLDDEVDTGGDAFAATAHA